MKKFLRLTAAFVIAALFFAPAVLRASAAGGEQEKADAFIAAVLQISDTTTVYDAEAAINYAKSEGVYFDDTSYAGVAEALQTLLAKEEALVATMAACESFVEYMSIAEELGDSGGSYTELRAALSAAEEYMQMLDDTYYGVSAYLDVYTRLTSELVEPEKTSKGYIACAERAAAADNYRDKKQAYDDAMKFLDGAIPDYPGVSAATATLAAVNLELDEMVSKATLFKAAVIAIGTGDSLYADIAAAYAALAEADETVTGVRAAKTAFEELVAQTGAAAEEINAAQRAIVAVVAPIETNDSAPVSYIPAALPKRRIACS